MQKPGKDPDHEDDRDGKDEREDAREDDEESPVFPGMAAGFAQVTLQQPVVAPIRFPGNGEGVAQNGNGPDEYADAEIRNHARQGDVGDTADPGGDGNDERKQAGQDIAEARHQADDAVDAEANSGEGNSEGFVEQDFKRAQRFITEDPGAPGPAAGRDLDSAGVRAGIGGTARRKVGVGHWHQGWFNRL